MVRCPYCGSTAQVKENTPFTTDEGYVVDAKYRCGCGCFFDTDDDLGRLMLVNKDVLKRLKNI